jgi:hypothetical protein
MGHQHAGHVLIPASVETYGYLGKPLVGYVRALSDVAACRTADVTRGSFLASAYRELSVALVRSQGFVYRACANLLARASGGQVLGGSDVTFLEVLVVALLCSLAFCSYSWALRHIFG